MDRNCITKQVVCPIHQTETVVNIYCTPNKHLVFNGCDTFQATPDCIQCRDNVIKKMSPDDFDTTSVTVPGL